MPFVTTSLGPQGPGLSERRQETSRACGISKNRLAGMEPSLADATGGRVVRGRWRRGRHGGSWVGSGQVALPLMPPCRTFAR